MTETHSSPRRRRYAALFALTAATLGPARSTALADTVHVRAPMVCSRGPSNSAYLVAVTMPRSRPAGSTFTVRIDAEPAPALSHVGLYYIYNLVTDYRVPAGAHYVEGSLHLVPGTGTANMQPGARVWHDASGFHIALPAHINNGQSFTPPSFEFELGIDAPAGGAVTLQFVHHHLDASVFLLGQIRTNCDPHPGPVTIGTVHVDP